MERKEVRKNFLSSQLGFEPTTVDPDSYKKYYFVAELVHGEKERSDWFP